MNGVTFGFKKLGWICAALLMVVGLAGLQAADKEKSETKKAKPYPLNTCIVSDESLGGDHGEPYAFVHKGQEFKLCCKPCLEDFDKDPKSYHKKLADLAKAQKKKQKAK